MQEGEDIPPRVGLQTTCPSAQLQGIGRYLNGYADGESDDSAEWNGSGVDCGQGEVGGVEDHRAWRRAGKECTRAMALRELRRVQGRTPRSLSLRCNGRERRLRRNDAGGRRHTSTCRASNHYTAVKATGAYALHERASKSTATDWWLHCNRL